MIHKLCSCKSVHNTCMTNIQLNKKIIHCKAIGYFLVCWYMIYNLGLVVIKPLSTRLYFEEIANQQHTDIPTK